MIHSFRDKLKKIAVFKITVISLRVLKNKYGLTKKLTLLADFFKSYSAFRKIIQNKRFTLKTEDLFPRIYDKTASHSIDPVYFYQDTWCAKKVSENKPAHHYDIASHAHMVGIISQFVPTTMIDIRPLSLSIPQLSFIKGDITKLPFKDGELESLSSICVIEHIGLGRYGDELDAFGSEKAAAEMVRVLKKEGDLYISVPVDSENRIYFNAHRAFTRAYILELFSDLTLQEERYVYGNSFENSYVVQKGFGTGLYHFKK